MFKICHQSPFNKRISVTPLYLVWLVAGLPIKHKDVTEIYLLRGF